MLMLWNALHLALRALRRNVLRSFLTILGVVIGVAAVIVMVTVGSGATAQVTSQIAAMGSNLLMVTPGQRMGPGQATDSQPFRAEDADALERRIPAIAAAAPVVSTGVTAVAGNENWSTSVTGSDDRIFRIRNLTLEAGRTFTDSEVRAGTAVCVVGATVRRELFGAASPLGKRMRLGKLSCQIVGVLQAKGQSGMGQDQDDLVVVPLRTFQRRIAGSTDVGLLQISVRDGASTDAAVADVQRVMRERRHVSALERDDFQVMDLKELARTLTGTTELLTALLGAVAAVSLLVGGIGIMNIMLVSVTERTREIGIRLAIGALAREVLAQFLVEAVVLSSFGGLVGVVLALFASWGLTALLGVPFVFMPGAIALAFAFSAAIGVGFGYFPARNAARLDPIEALR
ncbi:MAG TPA: ABC transporter permease, partial [Anaeromyxobacteraceae bacterium]|nr:ABC transporter permease [Anaeromyxobacteraceae bacterium]